MRKYHQLSGKEKAEYIAICVLYPFMLIFGWMGKTMKLFGTKKRQFLASVLCLVMILTMLPIGAFNVLAIVNNNLIVNPGGETVTETDTGIDTMLSNNGWKEDTGTNRGYSYGAFNNGPHDSGIILSPKSGSYFMGFYATDSTTYSGGVSCYQDIAVSGEPAFNFSGYASLKKDTTGSAIIQIDALGSTGNVINTWTNTVTSVDGDWKQITASSAIPTGTAKLRVTIKGILNSTGLAAFDDLSLTLGDIVPVYVAENTATGVKYETLQAAFTAVATNQTIKLLDNITVTDGATIKFSGSSSFALDLNGKTMSGGSGASAFVSNAGSGTLTVTDSATGGIITSSRSNGSYSGTMDLYTGNGSLIVAGGTVENTSSFTSVAICNKGTGTVSIQNGTVRALNYCIENYVNGKVIVSGGTLENGMIENNSSGTVTISGGVINGTIRGIRNNGSGDVFVSGGIISGGNWGINQTSTGKTYITGGSPVIKGGTYAMNQAPDLSGYTNVQVTASTDISGTSPVAYDETKITTYKYLAFVPGGTVSLTENFDDIGALSAAGWTMKNNSASIGATSWFQGNPVSSSGPFDSFNGSANSYIAANFNNTTGSSTISDWLITPKLFLTNGSTLTFYTRKVAGQDYPDRLEVRMSTSGSNPGTAATDVGDFTTLVLSINPTLVTGVYPQAWTKYTVTVSGLSESVSGYLAFRYFVTNGGPTGINSDYIGIDAASYTAGIDFTASGYSATYDGQNHGISLNVKTPGATVKYRTAATGAYDLTVAPTFSDVGTHTVWYQISKDGCVTAEGSGTVQITPKALTVNLAIGDKNYDGLNTATFSTAPSLVGIISGDKVTLVNGTPTFSSIGVGSAIPINFTAFGITGEDAGNYSLTQPSGVTANIKIGFTPVKDTHYTTTSLNAGWTNTDFVITAKSGFQVSLINTAEGTWQNSLPAFTAETTGSSVTFYVKNTATGEISVSKSENYKIDKTAPTGDIKIGTSSIKKVLNTLTLGWFFKNTTDVTITAQDNSGEVVAIAYYLSETEPSDVNAVTGWTAYQNKIDLPKNHKYIVYAKLTDLSGNITIINSDGIVVFTDSTVATDSVSFTKTSTADVKATVNLNGNTIKAISLDEDTLIENTDYTATGNTITLKASYLNTLSAGDYSLTVTYHPLGETGTPNPGSDEPASTQISLTISKAVPALSVVASPTGSQTRPNSVVISASVTAGATGELQFKANGSNIGSPVAVGQTVSFAAVGSVNSYTFTVSYDGDENYESATSSGLAYTFVKGNQDALSFAAETPTTKTYGDAAFAVTAAGGSGTGDVTYSVVSGPATISGNIITLTGAGTVTIRATKAADDNYNSKSEDYSITVSPKPVTITGVTAQNKTYDGSITATVSGTAAVSGKLSGDTVTVVAGTASFGDKTAQNDKTVTFTGFTLSGSDMDKYTLSAQPEAVTANITAKTITMNVSVQNKAYDGLNTAVVANADLNGIVSGDEVSLSTPYPDATFAGVGAASDIAINFGGSFTLTGEDNANYILTQPDGIKGSISDNYHAAKGTDYTVNTTGWSNTDFVITAETGFELSQTNTAGGIWSDTLTGSEETAVGSITFYVRNKNTGAISVAANESYMIDKTAPDGDIKISASSIKKAFNAITFGLFFKDTQTVTVTSDDAGSGVDTVAYKLSSTILDENAVSEISDWTEYTSPFTVNPEEKYVVYVKITDKVGNIIYIGSDGIVMDATAPVISGIEDGNTYCESIDVSVTDANLDIVTVNGVNTALADGKLTLSPAGIAQTVVATDKSGNSTSVTVTVYDGHAWDDGVVTTAPTASKKGVRTYTCIRCGETKTEEIDKLAPSIIEGQNNEYKQDEGGTLTFKSDAAFSDFLNVSIDGKVIDAKYYDLNEGEMIVTLKADYLATLLTGKHTLSIHSTTGTASAEFAIESKETDTVKAPDNTKTNDTTIPQTGDNSNIPLLFVLLLVSGSAAITLGKKEIKRKVKK